MMIASVQTLQHSYVVIFCVFWGMKLFYLLIITM